MAEQSENSPDLMGTDAKKQDAAFGKGFAAARPLLVFALGFFGLLAFGFCPSLKVTI